MVAVLGFSKEEIIMAVQDMYTVVAEQPKTPLHFPIGRQACELAGYEAEQIAELPDAALESFAGVGCPFHADIIAPGDHVLDIGSGAGTDVLIASKLVGENGRVRALDMTEAMRTKLADTLRRNGITNVEIVAGNAEKIPLPDASVDVVTSNGVLNLVPDKRRAVSEIFRVLKPGGRAQIADIVIARPVTPDCENDPELWAECVVGATVDENYLNLFRDAGFDDVEVLREYDYFAHSPSEETRQVAKQFGAYALELRMRRSAQAPAKLVQLAKRLSPRRIARNLQLRGLWGTVSLLLAAAACYGTLAAVALLSLLGVTLSINEGIWAGAIILFAVLATLVITLGVRRHRSPLPVVLSLLGTGILVYTMYVSYSSITEAIGFVVLAAATYLDYRLRRWAGVRPGAKHARRRERAPGPGQSSSSV